MYIHVPDVVILLCVMATVIVDHKVRTFLHITVKSLLFGVFQFSCISWIILHNELIIQRIIVTIYIYIYIVKPVYKGHLRLHENVSFMDSDLLFRGALYMTVYRNYISTKIKFSSNHEYKCFQSNLLSCNCIGCTLKVYE